jgi:hypothetical protein
MHKSIAICAKCGAYNMTEFDDCTVMLNVVICGNCGNYMYDDGRHLVD